MKTQNDYNPFTEKCINWNKNRYQQIYNHNLAIRLLMEETLELYSSDNIVDKCDAIGDIMFVAVGVLWKLGLTNSQIYDILYGKDWRELDEQGMYNSYMQILNIGAKLPVLQNNSIAYSGFQFTLHSMFITAYGACYSLGMKEAFYDILNAIADSNNTKSLPNKKVDSSVKANIDKGSNFVPPTKKLEQLIKTVKGAVI